MLSSEDAVAVKRMRKGEKETADFSIRQRSPGCKIEVFWWPIRPTAACCDLSTHASHVQGLVSTSRWLVDISSFKHYPSSSSFEAGSGVSLELRVCALYLIMTQEAGVISKARNPIVRRWAGKERFRGLIVSVPRLLVGSRFDMSKFV
jgi:hypothetical protein